MRTAERVKPLSTQITVVANRCTDRTAEIVREHGADVLENEDRSISFLNSLSRSV